MSDRQHDNELRARFEAQRSVEAKEAPSFASMMARARAEAADAPGIAADAPEVAPHSAKLRPAMSLRHPTLRRLLYAGGLAAAAAIAALFVVPDSQSSEAAFEETVRAFHNDPASGAWRSPTDGLLDVPGSRWISTVPSVGAPQ